MSYNAGNRRTVSIDPMLRRSTTVYDTAGRVVAEVNSYDANGERTNTGYTTGTNNRVTSDGTYNYRFK